MDNEKNVTLQIQIPIDVYAQLLIVKKSRGYRSWSDMLEKEFTNLELPS